MKMRLLKKKKKKMSTKVLGHSLFQKKKKKSYFPFAFVIFSSFAIFLRIFRFYLFLVFAFLLNLPSAEPTQRLPEQRQPA